MPSGRNHNGDYWRPGMNWFKPKLMTCQMDGCQNNYYQKAQTRRKYCDDCKNLLDQKKIARLRAKKTKEDKNQ